MIWRRENDAGKHMSYGARGGEDDVANALRTRMTL